MASILKRPRSRFWFAAFTTAEGRRLKKSTKTADKRLAQRIANEFEDATRKRRTALQIRRVIGELTRDVLGTDTRDPTFREWVETWFASKTGTVAESTRVFYRNATGKFIAWLGDRADKEISLITRADLIKFRNHRAASQAAAKTTNHEIKVLRMVFRSARRDGIITDDPAEFTETVRDRNQKAARRPFTIDELQAVLSVCSPEWRSLVLFGIYTGQRLGDIAALKWSNVDLAKGEIRLVAKKTGRAMQIPIGQPLLDHLITLSVPDEPDGPVHPKAFATFSRKNNTGTLSNQFADILAAAGLREKKAHRKTGEGRGANRDASCISFHSLRHTAVTLLKEAGVPQAVVQELIGHDSEQMSQHYTHVGREALTQAAAKFPAIVTTR